MFSLKSIYLIFVLQSVTTFALLVSQDTEVDFDQTSKERKNSGIQSTLVDELRSLCKEHHQFVNFTAMEIELDLCVGPIYKQLLEPIDLNGEAEAIEVQDLPAKLLNGEFVHSRTTVIVKHLCEFLPSLINCFEPLLEQTEHCSFNPTLERLVLEYSDIFVSSICKEDGNKLLEILEEGGTICISSFVSQSIECFRANSQSFLNNEGELREQTIESFCGELNNVSHCIYDNVKLCPVNSSGVILSSMMDEMTQWVSTDCLRNSANCIDGTIIVLFLLSISLIYKSWHESLV